MPEYVGYLAGILNSFLITIRSSIFKSSEVTTFILIALNSIGMLFFSILMMLLRHPNHFKDHIYQSLHIENITLSSLSLIRYVFQFLAVAILPLSISIPLLTLNIFSVLLFDHYLRHDEITRNEYIGSVLSFIGAIFINLQKILGKKGFFDDISHHTYFLGIFCILISLLANGYVFTRLKEMADKTNAEIAFLNESVFSGLFMFVGLLFFLFSPLKKSLPTIQQWLGYVLFFFFIGGFIVYLRVFTLTNLPEVVAILFLNLKLIVSMLVAYFFFKEHIPWNGYVGSLFILLAVFISIQN